MRCTIDFFTFFFLRGSIEPWQCRTKTASMGCMWRSESGWTGVGRLMGPEGGRAEFPVEKVLFFFFLCGILMHVVDLKRSFAPTMSTDTQYKTRLRGG